MASTERARMPSSPRMWPSVGRPPRALASVLMPRQAAPAVPGGSPPSHTGETCRRRRVLTASPRAPIRAARCRRVLRIGILGAARIAPVALVKPARRTGRADVDRGGGPGPRPGRGIRPQAGHSPRRRLLRRSWSRTPTSTPSTTRSPTGCTATGRSPPCGPASTSCARSPSPPTPTRPGPWPRWSAATPGWW